MQTPSSTGPILVAALEQLVELESHGRRAVLSDGFADLARQAARIHAVVFALQSDGIQGADAVDLDGIEDACALLQRLAAVARSALA